MRYLVNFDNRTSGTIRTDFLVIGTGVAGLRAAIEASNHGNVTVITKGGLKEGCTWFAQGGVAVAISKDDSPRFHIEDTLSAGAGLCDETAVKVLVEEGISAVQELLSWGAKFDMINGKLAFSMEGAHQISRIIHATGDATGEEIHRSLLHHARKIKNIRFLEHIFLCDLLSFGMECYGAVVLDEAGKTVVIQSAATVIASGGLGQIYEYSTNPAVATGDGFAAAYRAGCVMRDLEFIQFHPTILYMPGSEPFLISEAVRGEGGILKNSLGEAFMKNYHEMADLAPRDIVSRAIFRQMHKTNQPNVYLDISHLETKFLKKRFPKISKKCKSFGLDIGRDLIPVRPAAHFAMGGIQTNLQTETNLKRLFACGEAACNGVHGANRLASNSLLEGLVFGKRAGISASLHAGRGYDAPEIKNFSPVRKWRKPEIAAVKKELKKLMEQKVGIIRCESSLKECLNKIKKWDEIFSGSLYNARTMEMKNMLAVAGLVTDCALKRQESRGAHFRSDFPGLNDKKWKKPTTFALDLKIQVREYSLNDKQRRQHG